MERKKSFCDIIYTSRYRYQIIACPASCIITQQGARGPKKRRKSYCHWCVTCCHRATKPGPADAATCVTKGPRSFNKQSRLLEMTAAPLLVLLLLLMVLNKKKRKKWRRLCTSSITLIGHKRRHSTAVLHQLAFCPAHTIWRWRAETFCQIGYTTWRDRERKKRVKSLYTKWINISIESFRPIYLSSTDDVCISVDFLGKI